MSPEIIMQFAFATLLPVLASVALRLVEQRTEVNVRKPALWQLSVGLIFGLIAIFGTEMGISTADATMNVRDAAPLAAGLIFGGPAGIIAGIIGGVERWFAALWGRGMFSRVACSIATVFAGVYAASLRRLMFDRKTPIWPVAAVMGVVAEVLHLLLIFLTNPDDPQRAFNVVQACTPPMLTCNAVSVGLSCAMVRLVDREPLAPRGEKRTIAQGIQSGMLISIVLALLLTSTFSTSLQTRLSAISSSQLLNLNLNDVEREVDEFSDARLLALTRQAVSSVRRASDLTVEQLANLRDTLGVAEVSVVGGAGVIICSSEPEYIGFDMHDGAQAREFLEVLPGGELLELVQDYQPQTMDSNVWRKYAAARIEGGLVQLGYDAEQFQDAIAQNVKDAIQHRHVGANGFLLVADRSGSVMSDVAAVNGQQLANLGMNDAMAEAGPGNLFQTTVMGTLYYGVYHDSEGYRMIALQPAEEVDFSRGIAVLVGTFMEILVFALLFAVIYYLTKRLVVSSVREVNAELEKITGGDLDVVVDIRNNEEFAQLSDGINSTVDTLKRYITEAAARIDQELEYARDIQQGALPSVFPPFPSHTEFEIYASMDAAKEVGGDFYDFYLIDEGHLAFAIADVSGKGIPAALFMMRAKTVLKSFAESGLMVQDVVTCGNTQLCEGNESSMFVTAWMGVLDLKTGHLEFANAGHNPPALRHADGGFELLEIKHKPPLGCMEDMSYDLQEIDLAPGDTLFLYTDGVVEANNEEQELYGDNRLLRALNRLSVESMQGLITGVHEDVDRFAGEAPQFDDMTMLAIRYDGKRA